jgi:hypothetical protein
MWNATFVESSCPSRTPHILASSTAALVGFGRSAEVLGQVLDTSLGTVALGTSRVDGNELALGNTTANIEDIFDLVELPAAARKNGGGSELLLKRAGDLGVGVGLAGAGSDTSTSQPVVGGQILEQGDGGVEEIDKLVFLFVVAVTVGVQGGVTSSVLAPFVLPDQQSANDGESNSQRSLTRKTRRLLGSPSSRSPYSSRYHHDPCPRGCNQYRCMLLSYRKWLRKSHRNCQATVRGWSKIC